MPTKILELLYWEGQIDPTYMAVARAGREEALSDDNQEPEAEDC